MYHQKIRVVAGDAILGLIISAIACLPSQLVTNRNGSLASGGEAAGTVYIRTTSTLIMTREGTSL